jgi:ABC-type phosphate/phosphonate transport system substrate-binding protein
MQRITFFGLAGAMMAFGLAMLAPTTSAQAPASGPIKIGLVRAFFNDLDDTLIGIANGPFGDLMKQATGLEGELTYKDQAAEVARKLNDGELQVGVLHGHEFAWAQQKYPKLMPLMIAVNEHNDVRAFVIVAKNASYAKIADLRGKTLDMPIQTKEHCHIFLQKNCGDNAGNWQAFFKGVPRSKSPIQALDDIGRGKCDAVIVDTITLEFYRSIKGPFFQNNLRILQQSDAFPPPVIVYKEGSLAEATLTKFRVGLANAHKLPDADEVMRMWQIKGFETIPQNYGKMLADSLKAYAAPEPAKVSMR